MAIQIVDDEQLRHLIYKHEYTSVKYTSPTCDICQKLAPEYEALAQKSEYSNVLFLDIDAEENPTAKLLLAERSTPLIVLYHNGVVVKADTVTSIDDITSLLKTLLPE